MLFDQLEAQDRRSYAGSALARIYARGLRAHNYRNRPSCRLHATRMSDDEFSGSDGEDYGESTL